jgi:hypothetical protein
MLYLIASQTFAIRPALTGPLPESVENTIVRYSQQHGADWIYCVDVDCASSFMAKGW